MRGAAGNWFLSATTCGPMLLVLEVSWTRNKMRKEKKKLWTCIFHVRPHSMTKLFFISEKLVLEKLESPLILFYLKRENKTIKKTLVG